MPTIEFASRRGRIVLLATVLASGVAFLDATVVTVALPRIGTDLGAELEGLQWVLDAYLLTLAALVLVGGALGDVLGRRRVFLAGVWGFAVASALCAVAVDPGTLIAARALQGVFAALLTPTSLAILSSSFTPQDRGRAIGAWAGLSGVTTAAGPFVGGWLVDAASWRWIFLLNIPLLAGATVAALRGIAAEDGVRVAGLRELLARVDLPGAGLSVLGLGLIVAPLIEVARLPAWTVAGSVAAGAAVLACFVAYERRRRHPMLPPGLFRIRTFSVANMVTVVVYAALTGTNFLVVLALQRGLGYSALAAGAAMAPLTVILLLFSPRVGALLPKLGARPLLTTGSVVMASGLLLLSGINQGSSYVGGVLPGVLVMAAGLVLVVTPVTTTALTDAPSERQGVASGTNNAVARVGGLLAVAVLPAAGGIAGTAAVEAGPLLAGVSAALRFAAVICAAGGVIAWIGLRPQDCKHAPAETVPTAAHPRPAG
ncbi:MAG: MFS transporter [Actinomycetota bacterium]